MKKLKFFLFIIAFAGVANAQEFAKHMTTAKTSYSAGKLEDAHFELQLALQELDIIIGKEVLKLLPLKLDTLSSVPKEDNVYANTGFIGTTVHRVWGGTKTAEVDIISNSPLVASVSAILNSPMAGMMNDQNSKTIKVQGYKARMERTDNGDNTYDYKIDVPFKSSLLSFKVSKSTESEIQAMLNKIPLGEIAKLIQ
jgi:hypothetical protein